MQFDDNDIGRDPLTIVGEVLHPESAPPPPAPDANGEAAVCDEDPRDAEMRRMRQEFERERRALMMRAERAEQDAWAERTKKQSKARAEEPLFVDPETDAIWGNTVEDALFEILHRDHRWTDIDAGGGDKELKGRPRSLASAIAGRAAKEALDRFRDCTTPLRQSPIPEGAVGIDTLTEEWKAFFRHVGETESQTLEKRMALCHEYVARFRNRIFWLILVEKHGLAEARRLKSEVIKIHPPGAGRKVKERRYWMGIRRPIDAPADPDEAIDTVGEPTGEPEASTGIVVSPDGEVAS